MLTSAPPWRRAAALALPMAALFSLASCDRPAGDRVAIEESRPRTGADEAIKVGADSAERFGMGRPEAPSGGEAENPFRWKTPAGWKEAPTSRIRVLNFTFGSEDEGEVYLSVLPGPGGGTLSNLNRWRGQMGLDPIEPEALADMPTRQLFGNPANYVDLEGAFTPMGAAEPLEGYRMLGLIQETSGLTFFVKMTGPADLVAANEGAFKEFTESLALDFGNR